MSQVHRVFFLPGAAGEGNFWRPVAERLPFPCEAVFFDWPGLGHVAADPHVRGLGDLVARVVRHMDLPVDIVAHSMGGVIAVRAALERPTMVRRLVLSATSGGIGVSRFQAYDWRPAYRAAYPSAAPWILDDRTDLSEHLARLQVPTLLLWGDDDLVSPVAVGEHLARLIPHARLVVIKGGTHTFARDRAEDVASHIAEHLRPDEHREAPRGSTTMPGKERINVPLVIRAVTDNDLMLVSKMNKRLIEDEGSQNPMSVSELAERLRGWMEEGWHATLFLDDEAVVGYALYQVRQHEYDQTLPEVYVRQFFVERGHRRRGLGTVGFRLLRETHFPVPCRVVLDVLSANEEGLEFWRRLGFRPHVTVLELPSEER